MTVMTMTPAPRDSTGPGTTAFKKLTIVEAKLLLREPLPLFWGLVVPMVLLTIMGAFAGGPDAQLGGLRLVAVYEPILIAYVTATFAMQALPTVLSSYRERGILRRLDTTPVGASRVLGAQLVVNLGVAVLATAGLLVVGRAAFDVALPRQFGGFLLTFVLVAGAMLGLGLLIAALAPNGRVAGAVGAILFLPMMFFAGLWTPQATMPFVLRHIGRYTPLGAAVQAIQATMVGHWPHGPALMVLAAYALVFGGASMRWFRWD
jgi:ABC-2 type transport system permease protein